MRWLTRRRDDEQGAVAVMVALLTVVLLGFTALAVDVGANYAVKQQLQNGADAAVLAVAQQTKCRTTAGASLADGYVKANVNDGSARGAAVVDTTRRRVTVTATAVGADGADGRQNLFGPVLGIDRTQISVTATAACGAPAAGPIPLPLAFHRCNYTSSGRKVLLRFEFFLPLGCEREAAPDLYEEKSPGSLGWLDTLPGQCNLRTSTQVPLTPGGSISVGLPILCLNVFQSLQNKVTLIPIYDWGFSSPTGFLFRIVGFAPFRILGYRLGLTSGMHWNANTYPGATCSIFCRGLIGEFVETSVLDGDFETGGQDFGANVVGLVE